MFIVEGLALCHHMGTRALDPSSVLDYWLPAENMFTLDFYCAERGLEPKFDQNGSLKKNSQGGTGRQTMVLPALRVLFTQTILHISNTLLSLAISCITLRIFFPTLIRSYKMLLNLEESVTPK